MVVRRRGMRWEEKSYSSYFYYYYYYYYYSSSYSPSTQDTYPRTLISFDLAASITLRNLSKLSAIL